MQIIGNILLMLSILAIGSVFNMEVLQTKPGGDYGVGHSWVIFICIVIFWIAITCVAGIIGAKGGFNDLSMGRFTGTSMLIVSFLIIIIGANLSPRTGLSIIKYLSGINSFLTPLILIFTFVILMNQNIKSSVSPTFIKWILTGVFALNSFMLTSMLFGSTISKVRSFLPSSNTELNDFELGMMKTIDDYDVNKGVAGLFIYAGDNQKKRLRDHARLRIKSKSDWQDDLYRALESDGAYEALRFLRSIEVEDKARFAKGAYNGVLNQARLIREQIRNCSHPSHLYEGMFGYEVENALEAIEKFQNLGVDFKPAVSELRASLDEPTPFDNPNASTKKFIDKWVKKHLK